MDEDRATNTSSVADQYGDIIELRDGSKVVEQCELPAKINPSTEDVAAEMPLEISAAQQDELPLLQARKKERTTSNNKKTALLILLTLVALILACFSGHIWTRCKLLEISATSFMEKDPREKWFKLDKAAADVEYHQTPGWQFASSMELAQEELDEANRLHDKNLVSKSYARISDIQFRSQNYLAAAQAASKSLALEKQLHGHRNRNVAVCLWELFYIKSATNSSSPKALKFREEAVQCMEHAAGPNSLDAIHMEATPKRREDIEFTYDSCFTLHGSYFQFIAIREEAKANFSFAEKNYKAAILEMKARYPDRPSPYLAEVLNDYACFLHGQHRDKEAVKFESQADEIWERERKTPWPFFKYDRKLKSSDKKFYYLVDIEDATSMYGSTHPKTIAALRACAAYLRQNGNDGLADKYDNTASMAEKLWKQSKDHVN